jgi:hypothetical protein
VAGLISGSVCGDVQAQAALTGVVSSSDEGPLDGVLVSAKKDGSSITTTVVSDQQGAYSFPSARLEPGKYTMAIRAIGYRLDGAKSVDVPTGGEGKADLKLSKVKSLVPQLSSGEWLLSLPGADKQKAFLTMCVGCHTLQRVLTSTHDAAEFQQVFPRMARYSPGSTPTPSAALASRPARRASGRHRRCRQGGGGISRKRHARQLGGDRISAQGAAATQGPVHQGGDHGIRPAAQGRAAARRRRR